MLEVRNVVKTFDGFTALSGVDMTVPSGSVYGLVGPNGAGKSTILRNICGVYKPDSGDIKFDGEPVWENPNVKKRIAVIPDEIYSFGADSVRDMMRFYRSMYREFDMERYAKLKEAFPAIDEKRPIRRLSKGMQKQAAFWLALCVKPDYLLLDEPVDGLDPVMRRQVWSLLMEDVAGRGATVVVSSHNLRELEDVCDRVGVMSKGKVMLERSLEELQSGTVKLQVVFRGDAPSMPEGIDLLHEAHTGRVFTCIVRGAAKEVQARFEAMEPLLCEALPLTLEEIFIYEMGGEDYEVRDIVL